MGYDTDFLKVFCQEYTEQDYKSIRFELNEEKENTKFRHAVFEFILQDFSIANDHLIVDLYKEVSIQSKAFYAVHKSYHLLAQELLNRNHIDYLIHYLEGAIQCFDTLLSSAQVQLTAQQKKEMVEFMKKKYKGAITKKEKHIWDVGLKRFGDS